MLALCTSWTTLAQGEWEGFVELTFQENETSFGGDADVHDRRYGVSWFDPGGSIVPVSPPSVRDIAHPPRILG